MSKKRVPIYLPLIAVVCLAVFIFLALEVQSSTSLLSLNNAVALRLAEIKTTPLTIFALAVHYGLNVYSMVLVSIIISVYAWQRTKAHKLFVLPAATAITAVLFTLVKETLRIQRPSSLIFAFSDYSFPSGHASTATTLVVLFAYLFYKDHPKSQKRYVWTIAALVILLVAFSRVYLGVHWLTDVIGGIALGALVSTLSIIYLKRIE